MFATAIIVFRETLEAALFVGIVAAATRGLAGRMTWLAGGVFAGLLGALALAAGASKISTLADGIGQDLVNVGILSLALVMLAWHCIWVSTHGREMSQDARRLGSSVREGTRSPRALIVAVVLAVLREGAETVLFVAGLATGTPGSTSSMLLGAALGVLGGVALGVMIYFGLSRVKPHNLFAVTNVLIMLLAAAIASQLARALAQAGLVDRWSNSLWDTSAVLRTDSPFGVLLHALAGYDARPSGLQLAFYLGTLIIIGLATRQMQRRQLQPPARPDALAQAR
ncbi:FTR1 family protein [Polaromonas sp.]|uniref:FTR1 family iron permease n=1 Tax=Polaromonas sp. TaxID=1869339 RepID=UPI0017F3A4FD|nr:FTR1 family protein [Polaromonas sp.]NMM08127.1 iron permease [Polaromonas sp.]